MDNGNSSKRTEVFSKAFVFMGMMFTTCLIVSNLIAGKMWALTDNITLPASVILFPIAYILSDIVTELYGFQKTKVIIWTGFFCNLVAVIAYVFTIDMPYPSFWIGQDAFGVVLGLTPRMLLASFTAYLFGEFSNSMVLSRLKVLMNGRKLWVRILVATIVGEAFDSVIFILICYAGTQPAGQLGKMILFQYLFKVLFEVLFIPLMYIVIDRLKKSEGIDTYDYGKDYSIFRRTESDR